MRLDDRIIRMSSSVRLATSRGSSWASTSSRGRPSLNTMQKRTEKTLAGASIGQDWMTESSEWALREGGHRREAHHSTNSRGWPAGWVLLRWVLGKMGRKKCVQVHQQGKTERPNHQDEEPGQHQNNQHESQHGQQDVLWVLLRWVISRRDGGIQRDMINDRIICGKAGNIKTISMGLNTFNRMSSGFYFVEYFATRRRSGTKVNDLITWALSRADSSEEEKVEDRSEMNTETTTTRAEADTVRSKLEAPKCLPRWIRSNQNVHGSGLGTRNDLPVYLKRIETINIFPLKENLIFFGSFFVVYRNKFTIPERLAKCKQKNRTEEQVYFSSFELKNNRGSRMGQTKNGIWCLSNYFESEWNCIWL